MLHPQFRKTFEQVISLGTRINFDRGADARACCRTGDRIWPELITFSRKRLSTAAMAPTTYIPAQNTYIPRYLGTGASLVRSTYAGSFVAAARNDNLPVP